MERIEEVLESMDIKYLYHKNEDGKDWYGLVEFWTDHSGQDIPTEFDYDGTAEDFVKQFIESAENYDVDEQVEIYVPMRGTRGCPSTIRELLDDCQEAKDTLMEIAGKLQDAIKE